MRLYEDFQANGSLSLTVPLAVVSFGQVVSGLRLLAKW